MGSSNISRIRHCAETQIMQVIFVSGSSCRYGEVTSEEVDRVVHPGVEFEYSVGKAFYALIRLKKQVIHEPRN